MTAVLSGILLLFLAALAVAALEYRRAPVHKLRGKVRLQPSSILGRYEFGLQSTHYLDPSTLPGCFVITLLLHEDDLFFEHHGVNWREVRARLKAAWRSRTVPKGGSSISQQLVRFLFLQKHRSWLRKVRELVYAIKLERHFSKQEILGLYLGSIRFGDTGSGLQAAAKRYFNKQPQELDLCEALILCGSIPTPVRSGFALLCEADYSVFARRTAFYKASDFLRFIYKRLGKQSLAEIPQISYQLAKAQLQTMSRYSPHGLSAAEEAAIYFAANLTIEFVMKRLRKLPLLGSLAREQLSDGQRQEEYLLLQSCKGSFRIPTESFVAPIDWKLLSEIALRHNLLPRLLAQLHFEAPALIDRVPAAAQAHLQSAQLLTVQLYGALEKCVRVFGHRGLRFIILKGPSVALKYYIDFSQRPFRDLDIWIEPGRLDDALQALAELGFHSEFELNSSAYRMVVAANRAVKVVNNEGLQIDLHVAPAERRLPSFLAFEQAWPRAERIPIPGSRSEVCSLGTEDELLFLAIHAAKHCFAKGCWLMDIARLFLLREIDWPELVKRAASIGAQRRLVTALEGAIVLSGLESGQSVAKTLRKAIGGRELGIVFVNRLFLREQGLKARLNNLRLQLEMFDSFYDRLRLCVLRIVEPTVSDVKEASPDGVFFLYLTRIRRAWSLLRAELQEQR